MGTFRRVRSRWHTQSLSPPPPGAIYRQHASPMKSQAQGPSASDPCWAPLLHNGLRLSMDPFPPNTWNGDNTDDSPEAKEYSRNKDQIFHQAWQSTQSFYPMEILFPYSDKGPQTTSSLLAMYITLSVSSCPPPQHPHLCSSRTSCPLRAGPR